MSDRKRILLAKMGLDCHDTGIIIIAQQLREAGFEVIYLGLHNTAEKVVKAALEEDVDVLGLSFLSGQHMAQMRKLSGALADAGLTLPIICGGVVPEDDVVELKQMGVAEVIKPGTLTKEIITKINSVIAGG